ncbi:MAG: hypothetical protein SFZ02_11350 [bacterium]|nr:hypothetical protein [bacterium]
MKRIVVALMIAILALLVGAVSAQETALVPNELYLQSANSGTWTPIDSENGTLTLLGLNPRLQYTMTTPRLWSVTLDSFPFVDTWSLMADIIPLEAILSFDTYNVRLLLSSPVLDVNVNPNSLTYNAQVIEVINFVDETTKEIPTSFTLPVLTIQPTLDFTLALMDAAYTRLEGTRNADCVALYDAYVDATSAIQAFSGDTNSAEYNDLYNAMFYAYLDFNNNCVGNPQ